MSWTTFRTPCSAEYFWDSCSADLISLTELHLKGLETVMHTDSFNDLMDVLQNVEIGASGSSSMDFPKCVQVILPQADNIRRSALMLLLSFSCVSSILYLCLIFFARGLRDSLSTCVATALECWSDDVLCLLPWTCIVKHDHPRQ